MRLEITLSSKSVKDLTDLYGEDKSLWDTHISMFLRNNAAHIYNSKLLYTCQNCGEYIEDLTELVIKGETTSHRKCD